MVSQIEFHNFFEGNYTCLCSIDRLLQYFVKILCLHMPLNACVWTLFPIGIARMTDQLESKKPIQVVIEYIHRLFLKVNFDIKILSLYQIVVEELVSI